VSWRVYMTGPLLESGMALLKGRVELTVEPGPLPPPRERLLAQVAEADGLVSLMTSRVDAEVIAAAPKLRVIANFAVGFDNIDVAAATRAGIVVSNTPGVLTDATADLTFALLLCVARRISEAERFVHAGKWKTWEPDLMLGADVWGATLGIVGMGRIGQAVARRARGFKMRILYTDTERLPQMEAELGASFHSFEDLLRESDYVSLHAPLLDSTRGLVGAEQLALMKPTAVLINAARGPLVDQKALYEALRSGRPAAAGLDVTDPEPISMDDPLLTLPNCVVLPHIGSASVSTRNRMSELVAENLLAGLEGRRPLNPVNPEVIDTGRWRKPRD
jgi:glyoxylate reductase